MRISETLINKNVIYIYIYIYIYIKYRIFYQNCYEAKAIEETITYLILGLEGSKIDINNLSTRKQQEIGDTLVYIVTLIIHLASSTEIVHETQDNDRMNYFLVKSLSQ